jgi:hypothetical protein
MTNAHPFSAEEYLKFNDEQVTRVNPLDVLGDTSGSNANPYLLVYVRKGTNPIRTYMRKEASEGLSASGVPSQPSQINNEMDVDPLLKPLNETVPLS